MILSDLINRQTSQTGSITKVEKIVEQTIQKITKNTHKTRQAAIASCIKNILNGSPVCVTGIGRGVSNAAFEKHKIKRADRLCSNNFLRLSSSSIYQRMLNEFCQISHTPIILVDWPDLDDRQENFLLRATIAVDGRAIISFPRSSRLSKYYQFDRYKKLATFEIYCKISNVETRNPITQT